MSLNDFYVRRSLSGVSTLQLDPIGGGGGLGVGHPHVEKDPYCSFLTAEA